MNKRSMLAFASLAVGVVASLTAPSAHAATTSHKPHGVSHPDHATGGKGTAKHGEHHGGQHGGHGHDHH